VEDFVAVADDSFGEYDKIAVVEDLEDRSQAGTLNRFVDEEIVNCSPERLSDVRIYLRV
jgi:hypothetical protein